MSVREKYRSNRPLSSDTLQRLQGLPALCARHGLRFAYIFGSTARDAAAGPMPNDIDLAVMPGEAFSFRALYADVSQFLGTDRLDIVDMRHASIPLLFEIVCDGRLIYGAKDEEPQAFARMIRSTFRDFVTWSRHRERLLKERLK